MRQFRVDGQSRRGLAISQRHARAACQDPQPVPSTAAGGCSQLSALLLSHFCVFDILDCLGTYLVEGHPVARQGSYHTFSCRCFAISMIVMTCVQIEADSEFSGTRVILIHSAAPRLIGSVEHGSPGLKDPRTVSLSLLLFGEISLDSALRM